MLLALSRVAAQLAVGHGRDGAARLDVAKKRSLTLTVVERPLTDVTVDTGAKG